MCLWLWLLEWFYGSLEWTNRSSAYDNIIYQLQSFLVYEATFHAAELNSKYIYDNKLLDWK